MQSSNCCDDHIKTLLKKAVLSFRLIELKKCYKMLREPLKNDRKSMMQQKIQHYIDHNLKNISMVFYHKILEFERQLKNKVEKREKKWMKRVKQQKSSSASVYNKMSPCFDIVEILASTPVKSTCVVKLIIPRRFIPLFYQEKDERYSYEIQLMFHEVNDENWSLPFIKYIVNNRNYMKEDESPQIIYITNLCDFTQGYENRIELEFPKADREFKMVLSVVKRWSLAYLMELYPVKRVSKTVDLLKAYLYLNNSFHHEVVLVCPVEKKPMQYPCRSNICKHPDVFDLLSFLKRMQYFLKWYCPLCTKYVTYQSLELEEYFQSILKDKKICVTFHKKKPIIPQLFQGPDPPITCTSEIIIVE